MWLSRIEDPQPGDIVRSCYKRIPERHVVQVSPTNVEYLAVKPDGSWKKKFCLPVTWAKWVRAHRAMLVQTK